MIKSVTDQAKPIRHTSPEPSQAHFLRGIRVVGAESDGQSDGQLVSRRRRSANWIESSIPCVL